MPFSFYVTTPVIGGIDEYTVLLMHMDGDQSDSNHIVTVNGNPQFSTAQSKFGGSSMYFDGSGDYLTVPDDADWALGSIWTIDLWAYITTGVKVNYMVTQHQNTDNKWAFGVNASNKLTWNMKTGGTWSTPEPVSTMSVPIGSWTHLAATNDGTNIRLFSDGTLFGTFSTRTLPDMSSLLKIGGGYDSWQYTGYIDELRITKGEARWITGFTPPTSAYTSDANTKLLLHFDGDVSDGAHIITSNDNPQLSATTAKFDGAMYFGGSASGDYLSIPDSDDWNFGSGDFTIDLWASLDSGLQHQFCRQSPAVGDNSNNIVWWVGTDKVISFLYSVSGSGWTTVTSTQAATFNYNEWVHFAVVRDSSLLTFYINGNKLGDSINIGSAVFFNSTQLFTIGAGTSGGVFVSRLKGFIDELRISKGIARWTSNFTPETGPYTT